MQRCTNLVTTQRCDSLSTTQDANLSHICQYRAYVSHTNVSNEILISRLPQQLRPFHDIFIECTNKPFNKFKASDVKHVIHTTGAPCTAKPRRLRPDVLKEFDHYLKDMLDLGIISPSLSPWSSPLQLVRKKDGTLRPCGDFRRLTLQTIKDEYPLPNIFDLQSNLAGKTVFSRIDLHKGFWQIELEMKDRQKNSNLHTSWFVPI